MPSELEEFVYRLRCNAASWRAIYPQVGSLCDDAQTAADMLEKLQDELESDLDCPLFPVRDLGRLRLQQFNDMAAAAKKAAKLLARVQQAKATTMKKIAKGQRDAQAGRK